MCGISVPVGSYCHPCLASARERGLDVPSRGADFLRTGYVPGGKALKFASETRVILKLRPVKRTTAWERLLGPDPYGDAS